MNAKPTKAAIRNTTHHLQACRAYRAAGGRVSYTTDAAWLVNMAINRRAGWPDDPTHSRGSAMPVNGRYPKKAEGDAYRHLRLLAQQINSPRLRVYETSLGEWRALLLRRLPGRFVRRGDEQ